MPYKCEIKAKEARRKSYLLHKKEQLIRNNLWAINNPEKHKFFGSKSNAKSRNIEWLLTFDEWWKIWQDSGHWNDRGIGVGKYHMCRKNDLGPYASDNVYIGRHEKNSSNNIRNFGIRQILEHLCPLCRDKIIKGMED